MTAIIYRGTREIGGIIISHAHLDHYGLLKYVHPDIPVYLSAGTKKLIEVTQLFKICEQYDRTISITILSCSSVNSENSYGKITPRIIH